MAKLLTGTRVYGTANVDNVLTVGNITPVNSTSNTTGSLIVVGGVGILGNTYTGNLVISGSTAAGNGITFADGTRQTTAASGSGIDQYARDTANVIIGVDTTQNTRMTISDGVNTSQNVRIDYSNTAITIIQGVDLGQNTAIAATDGKMQSAYTQANTGAATSGYLANSVIFANTTGYLSNTANILFFAANNNLVVSGSFEIPATTTVTTYTNDPTDSTNKVFAYKVYPKISINPATLTSGDSVTVGQVSGTYVPTSVSVNSIFGYGLMGIISSDAATPTGYAATDMRGIYGNVYHNSASNLLRMVGTAGRTYNRSTGTVGNAYSLWARNSTNTGGGTITASYGVYIDSISSGATNYALYSAGGQSYFTGNVGIGSGKTTPATALDVNGTVTATSFSGAGTGLTGTAASLSIGGTAGSETLATVTGRGATTATAISITNATQSTSISTGALIISGGLGIAKSVYVGETLFAASKSFLIPHPTKEGMKLRYGSLEGPENGVYIRGKLINNDTIELPDYWTKLVDPDSITVNLTPIGKHQNLFVESVENNKVIVGNSNLMNKNVNCYFTVFAERVDVDKLVVEID